MAALFLFRLQARFLVALVAHLLPEHEQRLGVHLWAALTNADST